MSLFSRTTFERQTLERALQLAVLSAFAVAQPVYSVLAEEDSFFLGYQLSRLDTLLLIIALSVLLPLLLAGGLLLLRNRPKPVETYYQGMFTLLVAIVLMPILKQVPGLAAWSGDFTILSQLGLGLLLGWMSSRLVLRLAPAATFLMFLTPGLVLFPVLFLLNYSAFQPPKMLSGAVKTETPVVMIVFDEFPAISLLDEHLEIDKARFPNFAALAAHATWYRNAVTVHSQTSVAVPAILTGRMPQADGDRCLEPKPSPKTYPDNLFTWLGAAGYQVHAFQSYLFLCPSSLCKVKEPVPGFWQARIGHIRTVLRNFVVMVLFDHQAFNRFSLLFRKQVLAEGGHTGLHHGSDLRQFEQFLATLQPEPARSLYFYHPSLPHTAWEFTPSGKHYSRHFLFQRTRSRCGDEVGGAMCADPSVQASIYLRHLLQIQFMDTLLGKTVAELKRRNLYDKAVVVVVSDHGISFRKDHIGRLLTDGNFSEIMSVPLFIKLPNQQVGRTDNRYVSTVDILPTLAEALQIPPPDGVNGQSLLSEAATSQSAGTVCSPIRKRKISQGEFEQNRQEALLRKVQRFGVGDPDLMYAWGGYPGLIDQDVSALGPLRANPKIHVELAPAFLDSLKHLDLTAQVLPLNVQGRVVFKTPEVAATGLTLAVAVNGKIRSVIRSYEFMVRNRTYFTGLIPEDALRGGRNDIRFLLVEGAAEKPRLTELSVKAADDLKSNSLKLSGISR